MYLSWGNLVTNSMKVVLAKPGYIDETLWKHKLAEEILQAAHIFQLTSTEILIVSSKISNLSVIENFNPIQGKPFRGYSLRKTCYIYSKMMKPDTVIPYLNKQSKEYINQVIRFLRSAVISIFSPEISTFCYIGTTYKNCILLHFF